MTTISLLLSLRINWLLKTNEFAGLSHGCVIGTASSRLMFTLYIKVENYLNTD